MASFRKNGKMWRAMVVRRGVRVSKSFPRKLEAQAWATDVETRILAGTYGQPVLETMCDVFERYAREVSPTKRGARWEQIRLQAFGKMPIADIPISQITPTLLGQWRDLRLGSVQSGTVLREITLMTSVLEHCRREWRLIQVNPMRDVRKPKAPRARDRLISEDEILRVTLALGYDGPPIETLSQQVAVMFLTAIETAMRAGELAALRWSDVDVTRRVARLRDTKNGDAREVPLSAAAVDLLEQLRGVDPVKVFTVPPASRDALFRKARKRAGLEGFTFHDARAEACVRLSKKLDVLELARVIGHRDPRSLMCYFRETAEEIAKKLG